MEATADPAALHEELRLCALDSVRWRVFTGIFLISTFGGSHPHVELLKDDPAPFRDLVSVILRAGAYLPDHWIAFSVVSVLVYLVAERFLLRQLERPELRWIGTGVAVTVVALVTALHFPLLRMFTRGA